MLAAMVVHTAGSRYFRNFQLYSAGLRMDPSLIREIFRLGFPAGGIALLESGMFVAVSIFMGVLGAGWLAANQIMFNVLAVGFVIALSLGEACSVRVAQAAGAGSAGGIRVAALSGIGLGMLVMLMSASMLWFFPREIVSLFLDMGDAGSAAVVANAVVLAGIAAVFQVFDGLQAVASRALRGVKDTLVPMWIASLGYWLFGVAGGWALAFEFGFGARGLWWGLALGLMVTSLALLWRLVARTRLA
jgi:MATE family multidrug resistance protein